MSCLPGRRIALSTLTAAGVVLAGLVGAPAEAETAAPVADPKENVTFLVGLPFRAKALEAAAMRASTPKRDGYRKYLDVETAAQAYGATNKSARMLAAKVRPAGLSVEIDGTRLFARVTGDVEAWQQVMGQSIVFKPASAGSAQVDFAPFNLFAFSNLNPAEEGLAGLPASLADVATWIIPEYFDYVPSLDVAGIPPAPSAPPASRATRSLFYPGDTTQKPPTNGGSPLGTTCLAETPLSATTYTPDQLSQVYGLNALQAGYGKAAGDRVAVLSLGGGFSQQDVDATAKCFGHSAPKVDVKTGVGIDQPIVSLSLETALDLQTVAWALRNAKTTRLVQVANNTPGFIDAYSMALTAWSTPPDVITNSFGTCELSSQNTVGSIETVEALLQFSAVVGTSLFVAAGDLGSSACQASGPELSTHAAPTVEYPGSSAFVTAAGGTQLTLGSANVRIGESVWNDLQYGSTGNAVATGGPSAFFDAPWYQGSISGSGVRSVPDISALAAGTPGTVISFGGKPVGPLAGTSQASPLLAAGFAMISSRLRAQGQPPLGFINPWLYDTVRAHPLAVYDVTTGNNQYPVEYAPGSINIPACCQAQVGYDAASGLGSPNFIRLNQRAMRGTGLAATTR